MIQAERLTGEAKGSEKMLSEVVDFLLSTLDGSHTVHVGLLAAMWTAGALIVISKRGDEKKELQAVQVWLAMHNPMRGGQRMIRMLAQGGDIGGLDEAKDIAFSMLEHGYEVLP